MSDRMGRDTKNNIWFIEKDKDCRFRWRKTNPNNEMEVDKKSEHSFATMEECITNAKANGMDGEFSACTGGG